MGDTTGITWTDHTFNPVIGCTKVSAGCDHCYAETLATTRMKRVWGAGTERRRTAIANWNKPRQWNRLAQKEGRRHKVFCASMADVFDAEWPAGVRDDLWQLIRDTPMLDWQLLTKRTRTKWILKCLPSDWGNGYPNVWLGSSVENQETYDRRFPELMAVPAQLHWLSVEPLIGPITPHLGISDWVVVGGESGKGARPMLYDYAVRWRLACNAYGVPFFFKQWGDSSPDREMGAHHGGEKLDGRVEHEFPVVQREEQNIVLDTVDFPALLEMLSEVREREGDKEETERDE